MIVNFTNGIENVIASEHLYQWDVGQVLTIQGLDVGTPKVHFTTKGDETALVVQSGTVTGGISCTIPDKVLQAGKDITAYLYLDEVVTKSTIRTIKIPVIARVKPNDYIETNADIILDTYNLLNEIIEEHDEKMAEIQQATQQCYDSISVLQLTYQDYDGGYPSTDLSEYDDDMNGGYPTESEG